MNNKRFYIFSFINSIIFSGFCLLGNFLLVMKRRASNPSETTSTPLSIKILTMSMKFSFLYFWQ